MNDDAHEGVAAARAGDPGVVVAAGERGGPRRGSPHVATASGGPGEANGGPTFRDRPNKAGWLRIAAYLVLGAALVVLSLLLREAATMDQASFEAASADIGWSDARDADRIALDLFQRVNDERRARGLTPYEWEEDLAELARAWSNEMLESGYRHSDAAFRRHPRFAGSGENIAMGYRGAGDVHVAWMESDGHRDAILSPEFTTVGIGVVCRNDGVLWATEIFGLPYGRQEDDGSVGGTPVEPIVRRDDGPTCPKASRR